MNANTFLRWVTIIILSFLIGFWSANLLSAADSVYNLLGIMVLVIWIWLLLATNNFTHLPFKKKKR